MQIGAILGHFWLLPVSPKALPGGGPGGREPPPGRYSWSSLADPTDMVSSYRRLGQSKHSFGARMPKGHEKKEKERKRVWY